MDTGLKVRLSIKSLSVYRSLLESEVIQKLYLLMECMGENRHDSIKLVDHYCSFFHALINSMPGRMACLDEYIIEKILFDENVFTSLCEHREYGEIDSNLLDAVKNDLQNLQVIAGLSSDAVKQSIIDGTGTFINLPVWSSVKFNNSVCSAKSERPCEELGKILLSSDCWQDCIESLYGFYSTKGTGIMAKYKAFVWHRSNGEGFLKGIDYPDPIVLSDLIGYEAERSEVIDNTLQFLNGFTANNVLLYGDRGTGKSSTVKAVLNEYHDRGLRLVEVPKIHLVDFPEIIGLLRDRKQKFIIFVDDLVFEDNEENYTALKAALEGGIEAKPVNVLIYATSNRRHLIKERFSDRSGLMSGNYDDEVRSADTLQEKLSLSDRFGITVVFSSPDKQKYLQIVEGLADKRGIKYDREQLHREALKWELWYNGRSPRTARQFIDWLEGQNGE